MNHPSNITRIRASAEAPLRFKARGDLRVQRVITRYGEAFVLKDPLSQRFFRLRPDEFFIWSRLTPVATWRSLTNAYRQAYPNRQISLRDIENLVHRFRRLNLVTAYLTRQHAWIEGLARSHTKARLYARLTNLLAIRIGSIDPDRFLKSTYPLVRVFFHPLALVLQVLFLLFATGSFVLHAESFIEEIPSAPQYLTARNSIWLLLALACGKIIHELGHAYTCRHFGGECHRMGLLLLIFTPTLYVDTTDSWLLPNRWHRAMVAAAGIWVELLLSSVAFFVWCVTSDGLVHTMAIHFALVSSLGTICVNANPLLRYDGYYLISDFFNINDLAARSRRAMQRMLQRVLTGVRTVEREVESSRDQLALLAYGITSFFYRVFLLAVILHLLNAATESLGLLSLGYTVACVTLMSIAVPVVRTCWNGLRRSRFQRRPRGFVRSAFCILVTLICLGCFAWYPWPHHLHGFALIKHSNEQSIYLTAPGALSRVHVHSGESVKAGDLVAEFANPDLQAELAQLQGEYEQQLLKVRQWERNPSALQGALDQLPTARAVLADLDKQLQRKKGRLESLRIRAPADGRFLGTAYQSSSVVSDEHFTANRFALDSMNVGCWMKPGTSVGAIATDDRLSAHLFMIDEYAGRIQANDRVALCIDAFPFQEIHGHVTEVSRQTAGQLPLALSSMGGGNLASQTKGNATMAPLEQGYFVRVQIDENIVPAIPALRAQARIRIESTSLAQHLWRLVSRLRWTQ